MKKIVESIPNISEGRNSELVEKIVDEVRKTKDCILMDYSMDKDHNRSVITYMGTLEGVEEASIKIAKKAAELIDLRTHKGEHPRVGAVDVMPFVPLMGAEMDDCIRLSEKVGNKIAKEVGIPVFLYEESAKSEKRRNLADIRRGQFEGMAKKIKEEEWKPDFGQAEIHKSAGVVVVGARKPLIAFNVQLDTDNIEIANQISKKIRESSGGLKNVKAIGIMLESENKAQVSMNLTDYTVTPPHVAVEAIKEEAKKMGVEVLNSELIGLMPMRAAMKAAGYYLKLPEFDCDRIIENYLISGEV